MPGILTGTIIGLAQALGETAPLLLIGMVGFVAREYPEIRAAALPTPTRPCLRRSIHGPAVPTRRFMRKHGAALSFCCCS